MKTNYHRNKEKAKSRNTEPSLTDQSAARDTDINVIVKSFLVHGQAPGRMEAPIQDADFTNMPTDLRGMIEEGRELHSRLAKLPPELRDIPVTELLALTPEQLKNKLTPPAPPPAKEEPK